MKIELNFEEPEIKLGDAFVGLSKDGAKELTPATLQLWKDCSPGAQLSTVHSEGSRWNWIKLSPQRPSNTLASTDAYMHLHWAEPRSVSFDEIKCIQSFPIDYDCKDPGYLCGMSVPPFMMQRIADQIARQFFGRSIVTNPLRTGHWRLAELADVKPNGLRVVSTFACGGGSTMGYKLAGFEVIAAVEIDNEMADIYERNHHPRHLFRMPIQEFNQIPNDKLPQELFDIDVLDGSPPCSSFSMAGAREKKWGKARKFREGQAVQVLDDLFFHFIDTAAKLRPKVVVAENVKGLTHGNARGYVKQIFAKLNALGYSTQLFLLNASRMGVPQRRERVFFIANRL